MDVLGEHMRLVEEEEAARHVALEEELQVIQHGGVSKHEVHQLMAHQAAQLDRVTGNSTRQGDWYFN